MKKIIFITFAILFLPTPNINIHPDTGDVALGAVGGLALGSVLTPRGGSERSDLRRDLNDAIKEINNLRSDVRYLNDKVRDLEDEVRRLKNK